jgi:hypothetical protein
VISKTMVFVVAVALFGGACGSTGKGAGPDLSGLSEDEVLVRMTAYMTPGAQQAQLMERVGTWDVRTSMWMEPGGEVVVSEGHAVFESVMDGRFLRETLSGSAMDMPFLGEGLTGFDNATKQYHTAWVDSLSTGMVFATGSGNRDGHKLVLEGSMTDAVHGGVMQARFVTTHISIDEYRFEIWMKATDKQPEWKSMESIYTRS